MWVTDPSPFMNELMRTNQDEKAKKRSASSGLLHVQLHLSALLPFTDWLAGCPGSARTRCHAPCFGSDCSTMSWIHGLRIWKTTPAMRTAWKRYTVLRVEGSEPGLHAALRSRAHPPGFCKGLLARKTPYSSLPRACSARVGYYDRPQIHKTDHARVL